MQRIRAWVSAVIVALGLRRLFQAGSNQVQDTMHGINTSMSMNRMRRQVLAEATKAAEKAAKAAQPKRIVVQSKGGMGIGTLALFAGLGAGAMYLLDPFLGERRRSQLMNQVKSGQRTIMNFVNSGQQEVSDRVDDVMSKAQDVAGDVSDRMSASGMGSNMGSNMNMDRILNGSWPQNVRIGAGAVGGLMILTGLGRGGFMGLVRAILGAALVTRSATNSSIRSLVGMEQGSSMELGRMGQMSGQGMQHQRMQREPMGQSSHMSADGQRSTTQMQRQTQSGQSSSSQKTDQTDMQKSGQTDMQKSGQMSGETRKTSEKSGEIEPATEKSH